MFRVQHIVTARVYISSSKKNEKTWTMNRLKIWMGTIPFENRRHLHVRLVNSWYIAASDVHR